MRPQSVIVFLLFLACGCLEDQSVFNNAQGLGQVQISPDYKDVIVPFNIAPLNFQILSQATRYVVRITGDSGKSVAINSSRPQIMIPARSWHRLLEDNRGARLRFDLAIMKNDGIWYRYDPFWIDVSDQAIDRYLIYRLIRPQYNYFKDIGIYQRDLQSFSQRCIIHGSRFGDGCVNCHSLLGQDPNHLALGIRSARFGSSCLYAIDGQVHKIDQRFGHTTWHPSGRIIAFSAFDVRMFFHTARPDVQDVVEMNSLIGYYRLFDRSVARVPGLADPCVLETQPCWSADGRYLYFASGPMIWPDAKRFPPDQYAQLRYDINRIHYDPATDSWGQIETVVSSSQIGKSCLMPRPSPDGRFLLFTGCDYGCFPIYQPSADLYLLDLGNGQIKALEYNSDFSDSWHCWSSNSRWIVFASKRPTGRFTRLFIAYVHQDGRVSRPFLIPQKDPTFYDRFLYAFNLPELSKGPIQVSTASLIRAVRSTQAIQADSITSATPSSPTQYQHLGQR